MLHSESVLAVREVRRSKCSRREVLLLLLPFQRLDAPWRPSCQPWVGLAWLLQSLLGSRLSGRTWRREVELRLTHSPLSPPMSATEARFEALAERCSVPLRCAQKCAARLVACYEEPQRSYHTLAHISAMLEGSDATDLNSTTRRTIELAIWFHDAVYDPTAFPSSNEIESNALWEAFVDDAGTSLVRPHLLQQTKQLIVLLPQINFKTPVTRLILATIKHQLPPPDDLDSLSLASVAIFLNLDISILASSTDDYGAYARAIRKEYQHVPVEEYRAGRIKVLRSFLGRERIFLGDENNSAKEEKARRNLVEECEGLSSGRLPEGEEREEGGEL